VGCVIFDIPDGAKYKVSNWKVKELRMSHRFNPTYREFLATLVHEMIHIATVLNGTASPTIDHCPAFNRMMRDINRRKLGITVQLTGNVPLYKYNRK